MNRERREEGFFRFIKRLSAPFLELLFPSRCPACGAYVENRGDWCPGCLSNAVRVRRLPLGEEHRKDLEEAWAFGLYRGTLRELLIPLKFKRRRDGLPAIRSF